MTRDDIIRMAREALAFKDGNGWVFQQSDLECFAIEVAAAARAAEREACAQYCEDYEFDGEADFYRPDFAAILRARGLK